MKIDRIVLTHVRVPLHEPFRISNGSVSEKDAIIVSVYSDGVVGHGEASPMSGSFYSDDTPDSTWKFLMEVLGPRLMGAKTETVGDFDNLLQSIGGNSFARAGIETARWDLESKQTGKPLWELLGGTRMEIESGLAVGIYDTIDELLEKIEMYLEEGYRRVKIKIEKGRDLEPLRAVRRHFAAVPLMVDANCSYDREDIEHLKNLDEFGLMMIEQPLRKNDLEGHAMLQNSVATPVCLDESADDIPSVRKAIELGSCGIVNIKIQRVGGLSKAKEMHDLCARHGIPVWAGTMPELGIGAVHAIHLSALTGFSFPTDVESSSRWFVDDIVAPGVRVNKGLIRISDYSSYDIDAAIVKKYTLRKEVLGSN